MKPPAHPRPGDPPQSDDVAAAPEAADVLSAYRTASAEADDSEAPRAETRAAILAAAAPAVAARPQTVGGSGSGRGPAGARLRPQVPLALAASLMVGIFAWQLLPHLDEAPSPEQLASAPAPAPAPSPERQPSGDFEAAPAAPAAATAKAKAKEVAAQALAPDPAPESVGASLQRRAAVAPSAPPPAAAAAATPPAEAPLADSAVLHDADKSTRRKSSEAHNSFAAPPPQTPEAWLEHIADLRRSGRDDDAETEIRALRLAYPQVRIPPALLSPGPR